MFYLNQILESLARQRRQSRRQTSCGLVATVLIALLGFICPQKVNAQNYFAGTGAGASITTGSNDTGVGYFALNATTSGFGNTGVGHTALRSNTTADYNTALGYEPLYSNTTGSNNTALGVAAIFFNTTGSNNTATGFLALEQNTTASNNTADGSYALFTNSTGANNTATGDHALYQSTTAGNNTADGANALYTNTTGKNNTAAGNSALHNNTTGSYNTAHGWNALYGNVTGNFNAALGPSALISNRGSGNAGFGVNSLYHNTTGSGNIAMGYAAGTNLTTGNYNIDIGNFGVAGEASTIRIGSVQNRTFIAGIRTAVASGGVPVSVTATGQLGTTPSSKRFKQDIADMNQTSEAIFSLRPVSFHYKTELDPDKTAQFGLIAEEVAKINPSLVARDDKGEIYSVRYEAINAMLLNEFLKAHRALENQEARLTRQEAIITEQQKEIEALRSTVQKVCDRIEVNKPALTLASTKE